MIASLKGKIVLKEKNFVVLEVQGIGFKIYTKNGEQGKEAKFFTRLFLQRDGLALFGFEKKEELEMFEMLLTVSGVGPRSAMEVLSLASFNSIRAAIANEQKDFLSKANGISKRTAEKIIVELRDRLEKYKKDGEKFLHLQDSEAIEALFSLGYSRSQAQAALEKVPDNVKDIAQRVKIALKNLGK